jgi:hypothetical protein
MSNGKHTTWPDVGMAAVCLGFLWLVLWALFGDCP